jgi:hypothetical protein
LGTTLIVRTEERAMGCAGARIANDERFGTVSTGTRMGPRYFHGKDPRAEAPDPDDRALLLDHFSA